MYGQEVNQIQTQFLPESNEYLIRYFGHDGELVEEFRMAADVYMYAQGTSSAGYSAAHNIEIEDIFGPFDTVPEPGFTESEYQMYLYLSGGSTTDRYTDVTYGEGSRAFHMRRGDYFDKAYDNTDEQPDINVERGGTLDEFLEEFNPHHTTTERSDEKNEC